MRDDSERTRLEQRRIGRGGGVYQRPQGVQRRMSDWTTSKRASRAKLQGTFKVARLALGGTGGLSASVFSRSRKAHWRTSRECHPRCDLFLSDGPQRVVRAEVNPPVGECRRGCDRLA